MPSDSDSLRLLNRLDLAPSFTSLGLAPDLFRAGGDVGVRSFGAALSGPQDVLWLFRGEDAIGFDLRAGRVSMPPTPFASWLAGGALPGDFRVGLDAAVWAGPGSPNLIYLFQGQQFVQLDCGADPADPARWTLTQGPRSTRDNWLRILLADGFHVGPALLPGTCLLYGLREAANRVHFFLANRQYWRHNLEDGCQDIRGDRTSSPFSLPPSFDGRIDLAFYGVGAEAEHIFFFCRHEFAEYDILRQTIVRTGAIEQRFPALAQFLTRPQLYLVEDYALDTYVGPLALGRLVSTLQIPPRSTRTSNVVTRVVTPAAIALRQNLIEQPSTAAIEDFYARLAATPAGNPELSTLIGGGTSAGLWAGEVQALGGGRSLEGTRDALLDAALAALTQQAATSSHQIAQQVVDEGAAASGAGEVINEERFELANPGDTSLQVEFMELIQTYETLILLRNVRLAYSNGRDRPDIFALREIDARLKDILVDPANAAAIVAYLKQELTRIQDSSGEMRSMLVEGADLAANAQVASVFIADDIRPPQTLKVAGIIKAARSWRQPTYQTRAIDVVPEVAEPVVSAGIRPVSASLRGEVAALVDTIS